MPKTNSLPDSKAPPTFTPDPPKPPPVSIEPKKSFDYKDVNFDPSSLGVKNLNLKKALEVNAKPQTFTGAPDLSTKKLDAKRFDELSFKKRDEAVKAVKTTFVATSLASSSELKRWQKRYDKVRTKDIDADATKDGKLSRWTRRFDNKTKKALFGALSEDFQTRTEKATAKGGVPTAPSVGTKGFPFDQFYNRGPRSQTDAFPWSRAELESFVGQYDQELNRHLPMIERAVQQTGAPEWYVTFIAALLGAESNFGTLIGANGRSILDPNNEGVGPLQIDPASGRSVRFSGNYQTDDLTSYYVEAIEARRLSSRHVDDASGRRPHHGQRRHDVLRQSAAVGAR